MSESNGNGNSVANSVAPAPLLATVPGRNGGRLLPGGQPGNRGGPGRTPSQVQAASRLAFDQRIRRLKKIADGTLGVPLVVNGEPVLMPDGKTVAVLGPDVDQQLKAIDMLGKYGALQRVEHTGDDGGPITVRVIREARPRVSCD